MTSPLTSTHISSIFAMRAPGTDSLKVPRRFLLQDHSPWGSILLGRKEHGSSHPTAPSLGAPTNPRLAPQSESAVVSRNLNRYNICTNCSGNSYEKTATDTTGLQPQLQNGGSLQSTSWAHRSPMPKKSPASASYCPRPTQIRRCDDRYLPLGNTSCHTVPKLASYEHVTNVTGPRYKKLFLRYEWCAIPATLAGCFPPPLDSRTPFLLL